MNNVEQNTIFFILHSIRKNSEYIIKILNVIIKASGEKIEPEDEERIVSDFKKFKKSLLNFSKLNFGTTLNLCTKKYVKHEIQKDTLTISNNSIELYSSLQKKLKMSDKLNRIYLKKYIDSFNNLLNNTNNVFNNNIKYIRKYSTKQAYIDDLEQIFPIIDLIKTKFLEKLV